MTRNQRRRALQEHRRKMRWVAANKEWFKRVIVDLGWGYYSSMAHVWSEYEWEIHQGSFK